jgi:tRNA G37 N-methylase Trm5
VFQNKVAYYSPSEKKLYLFDASRNAASSWERKAVVYHEFVHAIDWQRDLRYSKEVAKMHARQIKRLKKQSMYTYSERSFNYQINKFEVNKIQKKMSLVAYVD